MIAKVQLHEGQAGIVMEGKKGMRVLKVVAVISFSAFFLSLTLAVFGYIFFELRWFSSQRILQCDNARGISFALVLDLKNETVLFEGRERSEDNIERNVKSFTETLIGMDWVCSNGYITQLWISRVDGTMEMWREFADGTRDESFEMITGRCYASSARF